MTNTYMRINCNGFTTDENGNIIINTNNINEIKCDDGHGYMEIESLSKVIKKIKSYRINVLSAIIRDILGYNLNEHHLYNIEQAYNNTCNWRTN